ncbi:MULTISPECIES: rRNA maturation RNase YbeY [Planktothrix]|jgi:probable rRNA maturation factor|uniref:Endoribonuclease YbeY n=2 Tax=Planktothrix agardhii TaxID=1160 RepID=A0A073CZ33_PLAA1|nr:MULTISPECIES: rRNA maturation RNase YbeY [Planktothrix]MCF3605150.1 rRNA maturation RNase YbeY [Planktothrix agardhii 1033]KEI69295.1 metalloprotease [Planktothrix agardhii NIVA-CYA 126/8]MBG0746345.1 rRNA maturation RNase YbeY [Planktothrix agardhii KL2]MCB8749114.1 rRNA maturation RNase YbeY [Planktothrix agardhii 1810]MCB8757888.1 rRNA maturation RNase YbeY [Planktothrix agardhii 1813]
MTVQVEVSIQDCFWEQLENSENNTIPNDALESSPREIDCPLTITEWEYWFQSWLNYLESYLPLASSYELSLRLTDDHEIKLLNTQYRSQDKPTDVLAFATLEVDCPQPPEEFSAESLYLGDIVISVETANFQAQQQGHSLKIELGWLATHGLLHLLGWDHPDDQSLTEMLEQQRVLLEIVNLGV